MCTNQLWSEKKMEQLYKIKDALYIQTVLVVLLKVVDIYSEKCHVTLFLPSFNGSHAGLIPPLTFQRLSRGDRHVQNSQVVTSEQQAAPLSASDSLWLYWSPLTDNAEPFCAFRLRFSLSHFSWFKVTLHIHSDSKFLYFRLEHSRVGWYFHRCQGWKNLKNECYIKNI